MKSSSPNDVPLIPFISYLLINSLLFLISFFVKSLIVKIDNIENYYFDGSSYFPCNESVTNCEKCTSSTTCYECKNNLKIILGEQNVCYNDNILSV